MALIIFKTGFEYKGFRFGWQGNRLFRLPKNSNGRQYGIRRVPVIKLAKNIKGYRIARDKKSMAQVKSMTGPIIFKIPKSECKGC